MKRRASGMDFALVWGEVSRWGQQDRDDLIKLMHGADVKTIEKKREPRKPRGGPAEVVKP